MNTQKFDFKECDLFAYAEGAAPAPVSLARCAREANKAAPCQFNKKMPPPKNQALADFGVSDDDLIFCKNKLARQASWLREQIFLNEELGTVKTLLDFTMSANLSKKYYAEVWQRTNTLSDFMRGSNHRISFLTITLNGCFRRALLGDYSTFKANDTKMLNSKFALKMLNNEPCDIRDLVDLLNFQWHGFFKRILKYLKSSKYYYIRAFEPHKDGVPHVHALISYPEHAHEKILKAYKDIFNAPQNLKKNYLSKAQKNNGEINGFQWSINNPTGYVLKYINKSFINSKENEELTHHQAWYIKYKVRRFTTSRHQIPLWIFRKINFFRKDFYELCTYKNNENWFCEWCYPNYFRLENLKTKELIVYLNGKLEHSIDNKIIHEYTKSTTKSSFHRPLNIPKTELRKNKIPDRTPPKVPFVNRLKNYALINYFKDLPASNTPHYALTINELVKRGLNGCVGLPAKLINLNNATKEIDPFAEYERKL